MPRPRVRSLVFTALVLACVCASFYAWSEARAGAADPFVVDNTTDDPNKQGCDINIPNDCSWRGAMIRVNATADSTIVQFKIPPGGVQTIHVAGQVPSIFTDTQIDGTTQEDISTPGTCTVKEGGRPCIILDGADGTFTDDGIVAEAGSKVRIKGLAIVGYTNGVLWNDGDAHEITQSYLGTPDGTTDKGNTNGISISSTVGNAIIGKPNERNVISGNNVGINAGGTFILTIQANYIGTDAEGANDLANDTSGILMNSTEHSLIGGTAVGAGNVISGNAVVGVQIDLALDIVLQGNYIGTNAAGTSALGNGLAGVAIDLSSFITIGGEATGARNVISANEGGPGLLIKKSSDTNVQGNYIGLSASGTAGLGNMTGIDVDRSSSTVIGGSAAAARNVISGNAAGRGISISGAAIVGTQVTGNYIGTNAAGDAAIPNFGGILIHSIAGATENNTVNDNVLSGNSFSGIFFLADGAGKVANNSMYGNIIGLNAAGDSGVLNGQDGIKMEGTVGSVEFNNIGVSGQDPNIIAGNGHDGIAFLNGSVDNLATNNIIGMNASGAGGLGNLQTGIDVKGALSDRNTISQNSMDNNTDIGIAHTEAGNDDSPAPILAPGPNLATPATGTISGPPNTTFTIEFFASPACDPSGFGEGRDYLESTTSNTGGTGIGQFALNSAPSGQKITATATDPDGNTSEFSNCVTPTEATPTPSPTPSPTPTPTPTPSPTPIEHDTPTPTPTPTGGATLRGDADCDGAVDLDDVIAVLSEFAGVDPGAPCPENADVDCVAGVTPFDAILIVVYVAGATVPQGTHCGPIGV